jgi:hypothetical protein
VHRNEFLVSTQTLILGCDTLFGHFVAAVASALGAAIMCRTVEEKSGQKSHFPDISCLSTCTMAMRESVTNLEFWAMEHH